MPDESVQYGPKTQPGVSKADDQPASNIARRGFRRTALGVVALALWLGPADTAAADHHKITLLGASVCSADTSVQSVRVRMDDFDEHFWENCVEFEFYDANATQVDSFLSPHDVTSGENVIVQIGTAAYAASSGTPLDMLLPANNIMVANGQVCIRGATANQHPPPNNFSCKDVDQCVPVSVISCASASVCGDGVIDAGEQCDDGGTAPGDCCSATCQFEPATTLCRGAAGVCDVAETCTGSSATCPSDQKRSDVCRAAAGACDVAESCNGVTNTCPSDQFDPALCDDGVYCNGDEICNAGVCEPGPPPECTGSTPLCDEAIENCSACLVDGDCSNGAFCDGEETCNAGVCNPGAAPTCESPTPLCDETLAGCVECQSDLDCTADALCETQVCLVSTPANVPSASPTVLFMTVFTLCAAAFAGLARRQRGSKLR